MRIKALYLLHSAVFWSLGNCLNYSTSGPLSINVTQIPFATRQAWCQSEYKACPLICGGTASVITCVPVRTANYIICCPQCMLTVINQDTLTYKCVCENGFHPNISNYLNTLPYFICLQWKTNCVDSNPTDLQALQGCNSVTCGSKNASLPIPQSSSASSHGAITSSSSPPASSTPASKTSLTSPNTRTGTTSTKPATTGHASPPTSSAPSRQPGGLSTGAKVGIGVGIGISALIALLILLLILRKRRKRKAAERARATGGMPQKPSPWPSLRRLWRSELGGQHDRPELEGSSGTRELVGSQQPVSRPEGIAELSAEPRPLESNDEPKDEVLDRNLEAVEMSATPGSPRGPLEPRGDAPTERVGDAEAESEWDSSNPPPIPYASKPRPP